MDRYCILENCGKENIILKQKVNPLLMYCSTLLWFRLQNRSFWVDQILHPWEICKIHTRKTSCFSAFIITLTHLWYETTLLVVLTYSSWDSAVFYRSTCVELHSTHTTLPPSHALLGHCHCCQCHVSAMVTFYISAQCLYCYCMQLCHILASCKISRLILYDDNKKLTTDE